MSDPVTPNMNLIQPIPGVDSGISAANSYNANFTIVDQHNHSTGSGVQITPSGLNINASVPFNNQAATGIGYVGITTQGSGVPTPVNYSIYFSGTEFYVKDGAGNSVQITSGGLVNATSSGISSGTASASFVGSVLVVNADTNKPANVQMASVLLGNNVTSSNYITLSPPNALASSYGLVLPAIPGSTLFMTIDSSGNMGTASSISASQIAAGTISGSQLASKTVTASQIADATITTTQISGSAGITGAQIASNAVLAGSGITLGGSYPATATPASGGRIKTIFGHVISTGSSSGAGWSAAKSATGQYVITFTEAFTAAPSVTATAFNSIAVYAYLPAVTGTAGCDVNIFNPAASALRDSDFYFIATGLY